MDKSHIHIQMFADFVCEWCYLAKRILESMQKEEGFVLEYHFMEIHPDTPKEGIPMSEHIENPDDWFSVINKKALPYGFQLAYKKIFANTHNALILHEHAKIIGKEEPYEKVVWDGYHLEGKNIGKENVLSELCQKIGYSPKEVITALANPVYHRELWEQTERWKKSGVTSVPTFIINNEYLVQGVKKKEFWQHLFQQIKRETE